MKRIFIECLPETTTEDEVRSKFSNFGTITAIEIKERKNVTLKHSSAFFAYVNLETDDKKLHQCFQHFQNTSWHGQYVKLQIAKESFLERLQRERESNHNNSGVIPLNPSNIQTVPDVTIDSKKKIINDTTEEKIVKPLKLENKKTFNKILIEEKEELSLNDLNDDIPPDFVIKNNKNRNILNKKLRIESVCDQPNITPINEENSKKLDEFKTLADQKRINSFLQQKKAYSEKRNAIQASLSYSNFNKSNKIIFNDNEEEPAKNSMKRSLFEDDDSDSDEQIDSIIEKKQKLQNKSVYELTKLQSSFKNDKRFVLDEKFVENEEMRENDHESEDVENEKQKQFEILEEILGQEVRMKRKPDVENSHMDRKMMKRFDPSHPDHAKYELKHEIKKKVKQKEKPSNNDKKVDDKEEPEVSKDVFYNVQDSLKQSLEENKNFSLLNTFGNVNDEEIDDSVDNVATPIEKKKIPPSRNPFKYDSSDDEDQIDKLQQDNEVKLQTSRNIKAWTEPFFFQEDDFRFQEGVDFVNRIAVEENDDFTNMRRNLKEIARYKVKNNLRKNKPFKKKLGGNAKKKIKRMNKALNR